MQQQDLQEHKHRAERIETLIQEVAAFPDPHARDITQELVQSLLDMYGDGLARILDLTMQKESPSSALVQALANDELVASLFLLHDLHPIALETRVAQALVEVRPYLQSHGGGVELLKVENGVVYLRLQGSCNGCASSAMTLKLAIEDAIYKVAPDLDGLEVEGVTEPASAAGTPIAFVPRRQKDGEQNGGWRVVTGLESLPAGTLKAIAIRKEPLLFCQIAGTYYAYHNRCASCTAPLDGGRLEGTTLSCSSCGRRYDVARAGRCLDASDLFLEPVPLLVEGGKVKVALAALTKSDQSNAAISAPAR